MKAVEWAVRLALAVVIVAMAVKLAFWGVAP